MCTYSQCSPHPAEQLYPSHAQKYILERFLLKENCDDDVGDDDDDDKPMQGMESFPSNLRWVRELSVYLSIYYFMT